MVCAELSPTGAAKALAALGSPAAVRRASIRDLAAISSIAHRAPLVAEAMTQADPEAERRAMRAAGVRMVVLGDADYPAALAMIDDPPLGLWMRGSMSALGAMAVGIVGARRASAYGIAQAGRFAGYLAEQGFAIVSGGARGVDGQAHRAALRSGAPTVAVVGCGLGAGPYPPEHAGLFEEMVASGGLLLSEFPTTFPIRPDNFPRRNRIISGVSVGVVVIEASVTSGALITARMAAGDHNRAAFALPGPVDSARSEGCNRAIRDGEAMLVLSPQEVVEELAGAGRLFAAGARLAVGRGGDRAAVGADHRAAAHAALLESLPEAWRAAVPRVRALLAREPGADGARVAEALALPAHAAQAVLTLLELEDAPAVASSSRARRKASRTGGRSE